MPNSDSINTINNCVGNGLLALATHVSTVKDSKESIPSETEHVSLQDSTALTSFDVGVWVDGCFDFTHYGHWNMLRQARALGTRLVVGVHSDAEIKRQKGIPVCNEEERYAAVAACRWVDTVVRDSPYVSSLPLMDEYKCAFSVHGDDLACAADGHDAYGDVKAAGRYREVRRTPSVSTTDLVSRMFLLQLGKADVVADCPRDMALTDSSAILMTSRWLAEFAAECRPPSPGARVVYVSGSFDLFHVGHAAFLEEARKLGDYLVVGVHDDATVRRTHGPGFPMLSLHERVLAVLGCRHVDDVVIGAPLEVTEAMIDGRAGSCPAISVVAVGAASSGGPNSSGDAYAVPRERGILVEGVTSRFGYFTTETLIQRIVARREEYEARNRRKLTREAALREKIANNEL